MAIVHDKISPLRGQNVGVSFKGDGVYVVVEVHDWFDRAYGQTWGEAADDGVDTAREYEDRCDELDLPDDDEVLVGFTGKHGTARKTVVFHVDEVKSMDEVLGDLLQKVKKASSRILARETRDHGDTFTIEWTASLAPPKPGPKSEQPKFMPTPDDMVL